MIDGELSPNAILITLDPNCLLDKNIVKDDAIDYRTMKLGIVYRATVIYEEVAILSLSIAPRAK